MGASALFGFGMGFRKMGALMKAIPDLIELYQETDEETFFNRVVQVEGFSTKTAKKVVENMDNFCEFLMKIDPYVSFEEEEVGEEEEDRAERPPVGARAQHARLRFEEPKLANRRFEEKRFVGQTFVFSGFRDTDLEERIVKLGGKVGNSVSKKTTAVIVKSMEDETGKVKKARKCGVEIVEKTVFESRV